MGAANVTIEKIGRCGAVTLNRPAALNSLDLPMVRDFRRRARSFRKRRRH